jgi:type II secretory pathway component PulJ
MSMLGTLTALVAFAAKPRSLPVVGRESQLLHAARARIEELESNNAELTVERDAQQLVNEKLRTERDAARDRVLEIGNAYRHAHERVADLEERGRSL